MNPYEVLGVKPDADMDTIKKAYRELAKKYHPDKYVNNPLADLASEKFKEINEAYDMITSGKASSGSTDSSGSGTYSQRNNTSGGSSNNNTQNASYQLARSYIQRRQFAQARKCLAGLPQNAEWYYLNGVIYINQGWYDKGREYISQAVIMDPNNYEYNATLNSLLSTMSGYRMNDGMGGSRHSYGLGTGPCDCCTQLLCADCLCECLGGDLISCC